MFECKKIQNKITYSLYYLFAKGFIYLKNHFEIVVIKMLYKRVLILV